MNFLGHSLISLEIDEKENKETLYGNFTGDFYKGLVERIELSENLKEGIVLHRIIDKTSDRKENLLNELLVEKFGIFKGIVSDMFIDHFLSKNFNNLFEEIKNKDITVLQHSVNLGKGRALKTAFNYILNEAKNLKSVVTADSERKEYEWRKMY